MAMKDSLITHFNTIEFSKTTADLWSSSHRSFLGMTAHLFDPDSLEHRSAALCCIRMTWKHDHIALSEEIAEIHASFNIQNKVIFNL